MTEKPYTSMLSRVVINSMYPIQYLHYLVHTAHTTLGIALVACSSIPHSFHSPPGAVLYVFYLIFFHAQHRWYTTYQQCKHSSQPPESESSDTYRRDFGFRRQFNTSYPRRYSQIPKRPLVRTPNSYTSHILDVAIPACNLESQHNKTSQSSCARFCKYPI